MKSREFSGKWFIPTITIILFLACLPVHSQSPYPAHVDRYVNDYADVISQPDKEAIRQLFSDLYAKTGVHAVVVTVNSMAQYGPDSTIEDFAKGLFNYWGVGHKTRNDGVLILFSLRDKKVRIEVGKGYGGKYNASMKEIIDRRMIPYFKAGDFSRGIYEGSRTVAETFASGSAERAPQLGSEPYPASSEKSSSSFWIILAVIVGLVIFGVSLIRSGRSGWGWVLLAGAGGLFVYLLSSMWSSSGRSDSDSGGFGGGGDFGGGGSSGDGASGDW